MYLAPRSQRVRSRWLSPCSERCGGRSSSLVGELGWFPLGLTPQWVKLMGPIAAGELAVAPAPTIFLDIDGVLNRTSAATHIRLEPELVARLRALLKAVPDARIVLSTFWRHFEEYITYILHRHGVEGVVIGRTPGRSDASSLSASAADASVYAGRAAEIRAWLEAHAGVDAFVILDDRPTAADRELQPHFVRTDAAAGLSDADVEAAVRVLRTVRRAGGARPSG